MRPEEYLKQNALGYEGDNFIHEEIKRLCEKHKISTIIETGTYRGATTKRLATLVDKVYTIENNPENIAYSSNQFQGIANIELETGDSSIHLARVLDKLVQKGRKKKVLFFLDAHWEKHCPLLEELKTIAQYGYKPVIVIHDWKVPNRPDLGFDSYNGQDYELSWIMDSLKEIYGEFEFHYNDKAEGAKRGVIYIEPKA